MKWITALDLQQWADTIAAETIFPELISDLIRASATNISNIRFPNGDKGRVRGFDGVLEATGVPPYVPDGYSIWEFGTDGSSVSNKANKDYIKRTNPPTEADKKQTTFVLISLKTWDNPKLKLEDWINKKRKEGKWKDVKLIDGSMIEDWLSLCPAVSAYYAKYKLGLVTNIGARSIKEFWSEYSTKFEPSLTEAVLLAGREKQKDSLLAKLKDDVKKIAFAADSPDEVVAFAIAAIRSTEPEERAFLESRTLVIDTEEAGRQLSHKSELIFLPRDQARKITSLLLQKSSTIVSAGADEKLSGHEVLIRPDSTTFGHALESMGLSIDEGYQQARKCGRSLSILARQCPSGTAETPEWVNQANSIALLPAVLAGAWCTASELDKSILNQLAGCTEYAHVEAPLRALTKLKDSPVDHIGDVWSLRSSVDAFVYLGHLLGEEHLDRFENAAKSVFSYIAPRPKADDVFKPYETEKKIYSTWLREGMATMLLHMAVLHEQAGFQVSGTTPQDFVDRIIRTLPGLSKDHRLLVSLSDQLPLLAEAAPVPFLEALERLLEGDASGIAPIFQEDEGLLTPKSYYHGVKWALEALAWEPDYLLRASLCLARLAAIDTGGTYSDRPFNSLRAIFLAWSPNTHAPVKTRNAILKQLTETLPTLAWPLLQQLVPSTHDNSQPTFKLKLRESNNYIPETLTWGVIWESQNFVIQLALKHAGADAERWKTLISRLSAFPQDSIDNTLNQLDVYLAHQIPEKRFDVWEALRHEFNRHRTYASENWSFNEEIMGRISTLVNNYKPTDLVQANLWLFNDWMPDLPDIEINNDEFIEPVDYHRFNALQEIMDTVGIQGLANLFQKINNVYTAVTHLSSLALKDEGLCELISLMLMGDKNVDDACGALVLDGFTRFGNMWLEKIKLIFSEKKITPERVGKILSSLRDNQQTWDIIQSFGQDVNESYWRNKSPRAIQGDRSELLLIIDKYTSWGRGLAGIISANQRLHDVPSIVLLQLLDTVVIEVNNGYTQYNTMASYYVEMVFDELKTRQDVPELELAHKELTYLPWFMEKNKPLILHRLMLQQPPLFMEAICTVYHSTNSKPVESSEQEIKRATAIYRLLEKLEILPGQQENEVDEETLQQWCTDVRALAKELDRADITDQRIGKILAHAPNSQTDNVWPHEAVRHVIEKLASDDVERSLEIERYNMRGVFTRIRGEGGTQERELALKYRSWATKIPEYLRTSTMLIRMAEYWEDSASSVDIREAQDNLRY